jgi:hypothetical protein
MPKRTIILASTEKRLDGLQFTYEALISLAQKINDGNKLHRSHVKALPFFNYEYGVRAWVTIPDPGGPAILFVEGRLNPDVEKCVEAFPGTTSFVVCLLPLETAG